MDYTEITDYKQKIKEIVSGINDEKLLRRIYLFILTIKGSKQTFGTLPKRNERCNVPKTTNSGNNECDRKGSIMGERYKKR